MVLFIEFLRLAAHGNIIIHVWNGPKILKENFNPCGFVEIIIHDTVTKLVTAKVKYHKKTMEILDDIHGKFLFRIQYYGPEIHSELKISTRPKTFHRAALGCSEECRPLDECGLNFDGRQNTEIIDSLPHSIIRLLMLWSLYVK